MGNAIINEVDNEKHYLRITEVALPTDAISSETGVYLTLQCNGNRTAATVGVSKDGRIIFRNEKNKFLVHNISAEATYAVTCEFTDGNEEKLGSGIVHVSPRNIVASPENGAPAVTGLLLAVDGEETDYAISMIFRNEEHYMSDTVTNEYIQIAEDKIGYLDRLGDFTSAIEAANMANLVYKNPGPGEGGGLEGSLRAVEYDLTEFFNSARDGQAMLASSSANPRNFILAFRGTEPKLEDFIADMDMDLTTWGRNGKCHEELITRFDGQVDGELQVSDGVKKQLDSISDRILGHLDRLVAENALGKLVIVGHSLGGALCQMGTVRILERFITKMDGVFGLPFEVEVYTFGAQRMCNTTFQQWSTMLIDNATAFRFVNDRDVVPTLPPQLHSYRHGVGQLVNMNCKKGDYDPMEWLIDHHIANYIAQLERLRDAGAALKIFA